LLGNKKLSESECSAKNANQDEKAIFKLLNIFCFSCIWPFAIS
jgi:hypothetical protein